MHGHSCAKFREADQNAMKKADNTNSCETCPLCVDLYSILDPTDAMTSHRWSTGAHQARHQEALGVVPREGALQPREAAQRARPYTVNPHTEIGIRKPLKRYCRTVFQRARTKISKVALGDTYE